VIGSSVHRAKSNLELLKAEATDRAMGRETDKDPYHYFARSHDHPIYPDVS
jgi:hypothetical protein